MGHAYQDGSDVVGFDADTGIYIKTYTIAQLSPDRFPLVKLLLLNANSVPITLEKGGYRALL